MSIFPNFIHILITSFNFMCFDIRTTKTKLCILTHLYDKMPNELGSMWTYFYHFHFMREHYFKKNISFISLGTKILLPVL